MNPRYDTCESLLAGLDKANEVFDTIEVDNRFMQGTALGWRDVQLLVKVPLPGGRHHIGEIQLQLKSYAVARQAAHKHFTALRELLPNVCKVQAKDLEGVQALLADALG